MTNYQEQEALEVLQKHLAQGDVVYTAVTHVTRSGTSRLIKFYIVRDNQIIDLSYYIADLLKCSYKAKGVKINGCGMDMCFASVYRVASILFNDGYKLKVAYL